MAGAGAERGLKPTRPRHGWRSVSLTIALAAAALLFSALAFASPAAALEQKLTASDGTAGDNLGNSVAIDGDTIVIGVARKNNATGAVYVYQRVGDTWTQTAKLSASDGAEDDRLGHSVAIDGDTIVAGAFADDFGMGSVYTFARTGAADRAETAKLTASDGAASDRLGYTVAIDGDTIVAGAPFDDVGSNVDQGSAYTFARTGGAARTETAKLTASDGAASDRLGSVAIDGDTIVAGAEGDDLGAGSAYTFARTGTAARNETAKLTASDPSTDDLFGLSVAVDGDTIVVGSPFDSVGPDAQLGSAYTFARTGAAARTETAKLTASDNRAGANLGTSVAIDGDTIVAGARHDEDDAGSVYTFARSGAAARTETAKLTASDGAAGDRLGHSVAIDGETILAGAHNDDIGENLNQGSAYAFFSPVDSDTDGVPDATDSCPAGDTGWSSNGTTDNDSDGCRDAGEDTDDDNDGKADGSDSCPAGDTGWTSTVTTDRDSDGCRDAGEDTDDDNDTVDDGSDACPVLAASTASGCPLVARSLSLSYSRSQESYRGVLSGSEPACVSNALVTVWKRVIGADERVGADAVNGRGRYVVPKRERPGRYYATVEERVALDIAACGSATSPILRLP